MHLTKWVPSGFLTFQVLFLVNVIISSCMALIHFGSRINQTFQYNIIKHARNKIFKFVIHLWMWYVYVNGILNTLFTSCVSFCRCISFTWQNKTAFTNLFSTWIMQRNLKPMEDWDWFFDLQYWLPYSFVSHNPYYNVCFHSDMIYVDLAWST